MTIEELAKYKVPTTGVMAPAGRQDAIDALVWSGQVVAALRQWEKARMPARDVAGVIQQFMAALEQLPVNNGHRAFTDKQRGDLEHIAHDAARVAADIQEKHPRAWNETDGGD